MTEIIVKHAMETELGFKLTDPSYDVKLRLVTKDGRVKFAMGYAHEKDHELIEVAEATQIGLMGFTSPRVEKLEKENEELRCKLKRLEEFKAYVHLRLDELNVPERNLGNKHEVNGCRVGGRLDWLEAHLEERARVADNHVQAYYRLEKQHDQEKARADRAEKELVAARDELAKKYVMVALHPSVQQQIDDLKKRVDWLVTPVPAFDPSTTQVLDQLVATLEKKVAELKQFDVRELAIGQRDDGEYPLIFASSLREVALLLESKDNIIKDLRESMHLSMNSDGIWLRVKLPSKKEASILLASDGQVAAGTFVSRVLLEQISRQV